MNKINTQRQKTGVTRHWTKSCQILSVCHLEKCQDENTIFPPNLSPNNNVNTNYVDEVKQKVWCLFDPMMIYADAQYVEKFMTINECTRDVVQMSQELG